MADHKSALKRNRQNIKRRARNVGNRAAAKTAALKAVSAIKTGDAKAAAAALRDAVSIVAKTARKGAIPKTRASRKIARLQKAFNKQLAAR
jgi:small subunit ribosomal protein S20